MCVISTIGFRKNAVNAIKKIASEMEVAPRYTLLALLTWLTLFTLFILLKLLFTA